MISTQLLWMLHMIIYCQFNCVLEKFTDITCICPDSFLCSYQYTQQNVPKSSNALRLKHIKTRAALQTITTTFKTIKNAAYERQYTLQILVKMKITINITIMFVNFSL